MGKVARISTVLLLIAVLLYSGFPYADGLKLSGNEGAVNVLYSLNFTEEGLPPGFQWGVRLNNATTFWSNLTYIDVMESPGNYSYRVISLNSSFLPVNPTGSVQLTNGGKVVNITFVEEYKAISGAGGGVNYNYYIIVTVIVMIDALLVIYYMKKRGRKGKLSDKSQ